MCVCERTIFDGSKNEVNLKRNTAKMSQQNIPFLLNKKYFFVESVIMSMGRQKNENNL